MKANIELQLKPEVNAFEVASKLNRYKNVKAYAITCSSIRVWYNDQRITDKKLLKLIQSTTKTDDRKRKLNVEHLKNVA
jgi:hypothetical protein